MLVYYSNHVNSFFALPMLGLVHATRSDGPHHQVDDMVDNFLRKTHAFYYQVQVKC